MITCVARGAESLCTACSRPGPGPSPAVRRSAAPGVKVVGAGVGRPPPPGQEEASASRGQRLIRNPSVHCWQQLLTRCDCGPLAAAAGGCWPNTHARAARVAAVGLVQMVGASCLPRCTARGDERPLLLSIMANKIRLQALMQLGASVRENNAGSRVVLRVDGGQVAWLT